MLKHLLTHTALRALAALAVLALVPALAHAQLTVYSAGPKGLANSLTKGFQDATGTQVSLFQATTGKVMARLEAERSNPQADVLISASWNSALALKAKGELMAYSSPNAAKVPAALKDAYYVAQGAAALSIVWNTKSGKPRPSEWSDLAAPIYRDAITMPDPAASGTAFDLVAAMTNEKVGGTPGWAMFGKLKDNGILVPGANAQALNPVLQGAKAAVIGGVDYIALGQKAKGESIEVIYPKSGTVLAPRPVMILKYAKNTDAAKKFVDYVLSEEGQTLVAGVFLLPARTDIAAKRPGWNDITVWDVDYADTAANRENILNRFRSEVGMK